MSIFACHDPGSLGEGIKGPAPKDSACDPRANQLPGKSERRTDTRMQIDTTFKKFVMLGMSSQFSGGFREALANRTLD